MQFYYSSGFISISHARYQACWIQKALVHLYERWHQMVFPLIIISRFTSLISKTVRSVSSLLSVVKTPSEMPALLFWSGWVWVPVHSPFQTSCQCVPGKRKVTTQGLGALQLMERPRWSFWFLYSAWHMSISGSLTLCSLQINTTNKLKKKKSYV